MVAANNTVLLIGRMTSDVESRFTSTGKQVSNFSIAVDKNYKSPSGEKLTNFFQCTAFGKTAEIFSTYLGKGRLISIVGVLDHEQWTNNEGKKQSTVKVKVDSVVFLDGKKDGSQQTDDASQYEQEQQQQPNQYPQQQKPQPQPQYPQQQPPQPQYPQQQPPQNDLFPGAPVGDTQLLF
jgi:single-strand DNA-binding protein